jgi:hypothetical protein
MFSIGVGRPGTCNKESLIILIIFGVICLCGDDHVIYPCTVKYLSAYIIIAVTIFLAQIAWIQPLLAGNLISDKNFISTEEIVSPHE